MRKTKSGELTVVGQGEADIVLEHPTDRDDVCVEFCDEDDAVPCDPKTQGELAWTVHQSHLPAYHRHYVLRIKWNVQGARTVCWTVCY